MELDMTRRIALGALLMLPSPPESMTQNVRSEIKDWEIFSSRGFPNVSMYTPTDIIVFWKIGKDLYLYSSESTPSRVMKGPEVQAWINKNYPTFTFIEMQNRMDARDRKANLTLYSCSGEEDETSEVYGGSCLWMQHGASSKIQKVVRGRQARKRIPGMKISRELSMLPAQGPFPGGSTYREARDRAEGTFQKLQS
jgi:hypothetical protein